MPEAVNVKGVDPAEKVPLGRTDLEVTRLGLGTAPLGGMFDAVSDSDAAATVTAAHELGWRLFDTAPLYGFGMAEARLGAALARAPRDELVISTKVGRLLRVSGGAGSASAGEGIFRGAPDLVPYFDFSAEGVMRSLEGSLRRLGTERVDIVHVHDPDDHYDQALAGALPALARLRREGVIGAVGAGMNQTQMLCRFAMDADVDCFLVAGRYTLLDPSAAEDFLPLCAERGIGVVCGGVFNSGVLAGGSTYDYAPAPPEVGARAGRLGEVCERHGVPLKAAAIQFPLAHPTVTCVVVGARTADEVRECDAMLRTEIPGYLWSDLRAEGLIPDRVPVPA